MFANGEILKDEKGNYYLKMNNCTEDDYSVYRIVNSGDCVYISSLKQDETPGMVKAGRCGGAQRQCETCPLRKETPRVPLHEEIR